MGALVGLGVGVGLLLIWSAFTMPRRPRVASRGPGRLERLLGSAGLRGVSSTSFVLLCAVSGVGAALLVQVVSRTPPVAIVFGVLAS